MPPRTIPPSPPCWSPAWPQLYVRGPGEQEETCTGGVAALLLPLATTFPVAAFLALAFGSCQAALWGLTAPVLVDTQVHTILLHPVDQEQGLLQLPTAFGLVTFSRGLALLGLPLGGVLVDGTGRSCLPTDAISL